MGNRIWSEMARRASLSECGVPPLGESLPLGTYSVAWHATSVDTHQTDGTYRFTLAATDGSGISLNSCLGSGNRRRCDHGCSLFYRDQ